MKPPRYSPSSFWIVVFAALGLGPVAILSAQTPAAPAPAADSVAATAAAAPTPAATETPAPSAAQPAAPTDAVAPELTKEQALVEIDAGLARFELAMKLETSPVIHAAMNTRLTLFRQRREDLAKNFTSGRFRALQASLLQQVTVEDKMTPAFDPSEGRTRRPLTLTDAVKGSLEQSRALANEAAQRDDRYRADRAAEEASARRMEVARINADLSRLSAQIDASTVGDPNRRAELNMRLRDMEQQRTLMELSAQPTPFDTLRADIQREADRVRQP